MTISITRLLLLCNLQLWRLALAALDIDSQCPISSNQRVLYEARKNLCDFFVSPFGDDINAGDEYMHAFQTLSCAMNPECNSAIDSKDVICMLAGNYPVFETIVPRLPENSLLTVMALGDDHSVVLDGRGEVAIFNAMSLEITFFGIKFFNGAGNSGGAVYSDRKLIFDNCAFMNNYASIHGGAVMAGRSVDFTRCTFQNNAAKVRTQ